MANQPIKIDNIALWKPAAGLRVGDINVATNPAGRSYLEKGANVYKISDKPMYRYAKNYKVGKTNFSLFVRSFRNDEKISSELDAAAKTIKEDDAKKILAEPDFLKFVYLDIYLKEDK